jgi:hypothetical protein
MEISFGGRYDNRQALVSSAGFQIAEYDRLFVSNGSESRPVFV